MLDGEVDVEVDVVVDSAVALAVDVDVDMAKVELPRTPELSALLLLLLLVTLLAFFSLEFGFVLQNVVTGLENASTSSSWVNLRHSPCDTTEIRIVV